MLKLFNPVSGGLGKKEMRLLEDIYSQTKIETLLTDECEDNIADEVLEEIIEVNYDLERVFEAYNECVTAQSEFVKKYPAFDEVRLKNCDSLNELGKSLNLDRKNSNIARLVGNVTSFIGGSVAVSSAVLAPITFGLSVPLGIAGASIVAAGSATSAGTSLTEFLLVKDKVKKAQAIVDNDKKALGDLDCWLKPACELAESLDRISKLDLVRDMMDVLSEHIEQVIKIKQGSKRNKAIEMLVKAALVFLPVDLAPVVKHVVNLITMLSAIIMLQRKNQLIFDCASLIFKSALAILSFLDICIDGGITVAQLVSGNAAIGKTIGKAVARGTLAVFSMTLDVASIVLTSIDVHNGSLSEEGQMMIQTAEKLKEQNDELRKVFETMKN